MRYALFAALLLSTSAIAGEMPPAPPDAALNEADNLKLACLRTAFESDAMPNAPRGSGPNGIYCVERIEDFARRACPGKLERDQAIMDVQRGAMEDATLGRWASTDQMLGFMLPACLAGA